MSKSINIKIKKQKVSQAAVTTASTTELIVSTAGFVANNVAVGDIIYNITDPEFSTVASVDSETTVTVDAASSGFSVDDVVIVMSSTLTENYPLNIDSIIRVSIFDSSSKLTTLNINLSVGNTSDDRMLKIALKNRLLTDAARNKCIDNFMSDINNCLSSNYANIQTTSNPPDANTYMVATTLLQA